MTGSTPYLTTCPYCGERISKNSKQKHLLTKHPDRPTPSDSGFPGWKQE